MEGNDGDCISETAMVPSAMTEEAEISILSAAGESFISETSQTGTAGLPTEISARSAGSPASNKSIEEIKWKESVLLRAKSKRNEPISVPEYGDIALENEQLQSLLNEQLPDVVRSYIENPSKRHENCNVLLVSGSKKVPCHTEVLMACAPSSREVFKEKPRALESEPMPKHHMNLPDGNVLPLLIENLYNGCSKLNIEEARQLLEVSTKFGFQYLTSRCVALCLGHLNVDNAVEMKILSITSTNQALSIALDEFIMKNLAGLLASPVFADLSLEHILRVMDAGNSRIPDEAVNAIADTWVSKKQRNDNSNLIIQIETAKLYRNAKKRELSIFDGKPPEVALPASETSVPGWVFLTSLVTPKAAAASSKACNTINTRGEKIKVKLIDEPPTVTPVRDGNKRKRMDNAEEQDAKVPKIEDGNTPRSSLNPLPRSPMFTSTPSAPGSSARTSFSNSETSINTTPKPAPPVAAAAAVEEEDWEDGTVDPSVANAPQQNDRFGGGRGGGRGGFNGGNRFGNDNGGGRGQGFGGNDDRGDRGFGGGGRGFGGRGSRDDGNGDRGFGGRNNDNGGGFGGNRDGDNNRGGFGGNRSFGGDRDNGGGGGGGYGNRGGFGGGNRDDGGRFGNRSFGNDGGDRGFGGGRSYGNDGDGGGSRDGGFNNRGGFRGGRGGGGFDRSGGGGDRGGYGGNRDDNGGGGRFNDGDRGGFGGRGGRGGFRGGRDGGGGFGGNSNAPPAVVAEDEDWDDGSSAPSTTPADGTFKKPEAPLAIKTPEPKPAFGGNSFGGSGSNYSSDQPSDDKDQGQSSGFSGRGGGYNGGRGGAGGGYGRGRDDGGESLKDPRSSRGGSRESSVDRFGGGDNNQGGNSGGYGGGNRGRGGFDRFGGDRGGDGGFGGRGGGRGGGGRFGDRDSSFNRDGDGGNDRFGGNRSFDRDSGSGGDRFGGGRGGGRFNDGGDRFGGGGGGGRFGGGDSGEDRFGGGGRGGGGRGGFGGGDSGEDRFGGGGRGGGRGGYGGGDSGEDRFGGGGRGGGRGGFGGGNSGEDRFGGGGGRGGGRGGFGGGRGGGRGGFGGAPSGPPPEIAEDEAWD